MTMWMPNGDVEFDFSDLPSIDLPNKRRRSRRRGWREGLADQTVVRDFEDVRAYRAFERALIGSVDPRSAIELALVHRLTNLLWRLRRASAVETGLFEIQSEPLPARQQHPSRGASQQTALPTPTRLNGHGTALGSNGPHEPQVSNREPLSTSMRPPLNIAQRFLSLSSLDATLLDRLGRHEARLWRQAVQIIWTLDAIRRPQPASARRPSRTPLARFYWNAER